MKRYLVALMVCAFAAAVTVPVASAHSGGTDKNGCHNDNKNGGRHCH